MPYLKRLIFSALLILPCLIYSQIVHVGLLNQTQLQTIVISIVQGNYGLTNDKNDTLVIGEKSIIYISRINDSLSVIMPNKNIGMSKQINLIDINGDGVFCLQSVMPKLKKRSYNNNLEIHIKWGRIQAINKVNLEPYISGVVEAEGGANAGIEYYKIQAVLARTYALGHLDRHTGEGFHLCDGVHCQAFNGLSARNIQIIEATKATAGVVAIDTDSILITAAFHANCGGQTESSEKVWLINKSYLRPVQDPYCQNQRSFNWEKSLTLKEWTDYLIKNKFKVNNTTPPSYYNYTQIHRQLWYIVKSDSLLLTKIRADLNLRSTFFSVSVDKQKVIIKGHGFGHGVGLCQDGAIQMAKLNYNYQDILKFYFQNISTISYLDVPKVKNPSLMLMEY